MKGQDLFFERITTSGLEPTTSVHGISKDSLGYLWFGSWNGLFRYNGNKYELYQLNKIDSSANLSNRIRNVVSDEDQQLWVLTFENRYLRYQYEQNTFIILPDNQVSPEIQHLLKSTANQLHRDKIIGEYRYYLSNNIFTEFNTSTGKAHNYYSDNINPGGLLDENITSYFIDERNILWLGCSNGMVYMSNLHRKPFMLKPLPIEKAGKLTFASIRAISKAEDNLWLGTNNNGLYKTSNSKKITNCPSDNIRSILEDSNGNTWIGSTNGLGIYNPKTKVYQPIISQQLIPELIIYSIYSLAPSHKERIWAGLYNAVASIDLKTQQVKITDLSALIANHSIMDLLEIDNNLWLATEGNGILRLRFNTKGDLIDTELISNVTNTVNKGNFLPGKLVYCLYKDQQGDLWAGTSEGLCCIDPVSFSVRQVSLESNLPVDYISGITGDKNNTIWVSHKMGISKIVKKDFGVTNYYINDDDNNWVFMDGAVYNDTTNNTIYFGAREGYVSFNPEAIKPDEHKPKIVLSSISVSGKEMAPHESINGQKVLDNMLSHTKELTLSDKNSSFSILVDALYYQDIQGIRYYYQLEGYNKTWLSSNFNKASYTKVPSGDYLFRVKALSADANWSDELSIRIKILPPWYKTIWAYAIYFILILVTLLILYRIIIIREKLKNQLLLQRLKAEKQEEVNNQKLAFFTNVTHEFKTPLTLIADPVKQLQKNNISDENRKLYLHIIDKNIATLTTLINQLLEFRKSDKDKLTLNNSVVNLVDSIAECISTFGAIAKSRSIQLTFENKIQSLPLKIDADKVKQIINNLLSNAIKYTADGGSIIVKLGPNDAKNICFTITDNGIGISANGLKHIFEPFNSEGVKPFFGSSSGMGLALTKKLVDLMGGTITIKSNKGKGTTANVHLPYLKPDNNTIPEETVYFDKNHPTKKTNPIVLIAEDSTDLQIYLKTELSTTYDIHITDNGIDAYQKAKEIIPDIIISDIMMPMMDGIELCKKIKTNEKTSHIPVVLLTAKTTDNNKIEGLKTGADVYIPKPFSIDVLKAQVESIIQIRKQLQQRLSKSKFTSELKLTENSINNTFLEKAIEITKANIGNDQFGTEALAGDLKMSRSQLYRKLSAVTGSSVREFILKIRMEEAVRLLSNPELNISDIAYKTSFSESSNFSRSFSNYFGCSPSEYRNKTY